MSEPAFIDLADGDGSYVAAHIDLEPCPRCKSDPPPRLHPRLSKCGRAHEADHCLRCGGTWWHNWPFEPRADMIRPTP